MRKLLVILNAMLRKQTHWHATALASSTSTLHPLADAGFPNTVAARVSNDPRRASWRADTRYFTTLILNATSSCPAGVSRSPALTGSCPNWLTLTRLARRLEISIVAQSIATFPAIRSFSATAVTFLTTVWMERRGRKKSRRPPQLNPLYVENRDLDERELAAALAHRGELVFEKQLFDVFAGNRNAQLLLTQLLAPFHDVVLYGVYTEVCVRDAVNGLVGIGPQIHVVIDAIADIGDAGDGYRKQWIDAGVRLLTWPNWPRRSKELRVSAW